MPVEWLDAPAVIGPVDRSADAGLARAGLESVVAAHPDLAAELAEGGQALDALVALSCASDSLIRVAARDRDAVVELLEDGSLAAPRGSAQYRGSGLAAVESAEPAAALRRWKHREMLRIAARDLLGLADLRVVGRELAALAEACLVAALAIAEPSVPMTIVGMGKLGGRELNYASDVDVLFVHEGDAAEAERAARRVLRAMSDATSDGIVFRTDASLRPEGRNGPLSRTLASYDAYWERWAQTWEFQALIKARPVAGDRSIAEQFASRVPRVVWPPQPRPEAVRDIRAMKARSEEQLRKRGTQQREVKRGIGGIRDVEFAVQLLQMVHGRHDESLRSPTTLDALEALARGGYVSVEDAESLDDAYVWLRTVEHRIQLVDEQQTHLLPAGERELTRLARVLGYRDRGNESAADQFLARHGAKQVAVRSLHQKLFFAPVLDTIAGVGTLTEQSLEERLVAFGFQDTQSTRAALTELTAGLTRRSRVLQQVLPAVLGWLSVAPDPDLGLLQLRRLTEGPTRSATLARTLRESPVAAERACRLLGSSRVLGLALYREPEFLDALGGTDTLAQEPSRDDLAASAVSTLDWREDEHGRRAGLRRFKRRNLLRVGARDLLGITDLDTTQRELAHLADATLEAALRSLEPSIPFAVIGLGRLGGEELAYASDLDLMFVYRGESAAAFEIAERIATRLVAALGETTSEGQTWVVDTRLRPEGRQGPLARSLGAFRHYYENYAQPWEFQSLLRARIVAGDSEVGAAFIAMIEPFVYREPFPTAHVREIRRVKARVERERIPPGEDPTFHLKLGRGSISDVEFTCQLLQLCHGARTPSVRSGSTLTALARLLAAGILGNEDAAALHDAYVLCVRARDARYLLTGTPRDSLPNDASEGEKVARIVGYDTRPWATLRDDYRRVTRRCREVTERLFYGRE